MRVFAAEADLVVQVVPRESPGCYQDLSRIWHPKMSTGAVSHSIQKNTTFRKFIRAFPFHSPTAFEHVEDANILASFDLSQGE